MAVAPFIVVEGEPMAAALEQPDHPLGIARRRSLEPAAALAGAEGAIGILGPRALRLSRLDRHHSPAIARHRIDCRVEGRALIVARNGDPRLAAAPGSSMIARVQLSP